MTDPFAALAAYPRLLVCSDVDSTFIGQEVIELIARRAGTEAEVAAVTAAAMRGELDFAASLRARVATLAGLPVAVLAEVRKEVTLTPGVPELLRWAAEHGHVVALVSGGFHEVIDPLAATLGIRHVRANRLAVRDGLLTGEVDGPIIDRAGKAVALRQFAAVEDIPLSATIAIGDGANDLDMLALAGLSVAFAAKPVVAERADIALPGPRLDDLLPLLELARG
ncbi:MAG: phosphoserine phosphatase SerB [Actinobacteria bacterium]|uniref:phosphoserine phosphatase n=1 Tax=Nostocoides veronense TaxID=330836 RepID=A0ABN2LDJ0_9MICO|nr:phosphoserine phosphatase SerB [Actinomycetota bacterium]